MKSTLNTLWEKKYWHMLFFVWFLSSTLLFISAHSNGLVLAYYLWLIAYAPLFWMGYLGAGFLTLLSLALHGYAISTTGMVLVAVTLLCCVVRQIISIGFFTALIGAVAVVYGVVMPVGLWTGMLYSGILAVTGMIVYRHESQE